MVPEAFDRLLRAGSIMIHFRHLSSIFKSISRTPTILRCFHSTIDRLEVKELIGHENVKTLMKYLHPTIILWKYTKTAISL